MPRVIVVGAGVGGLVSALLLATRGFSVTVLERAERSGGKLRVLDVAGRAIDSGPTVFTMRGVLDAIFEEAGTRLDDHLKLRRADILARHAWPDGSVLDLYADIGATADAVSRFAGPAEARGYRAFCARTAEVFQTLDEPFMRNPAPSPIGLALGAGIGGLGALTRIRPFSSLWDVVSSYFKDPRLRQMFGRYATYCGSSPFAAPGPLMLIAHVEQAGVWSVEGGMVRVADALERLAIARGVTFRYGADVDDLLMQDGRACGARLVTGEEIHSDAVVFNGDPAALFAGLVGDRSRHAVSPWAHAERSLSAMTWSIVGTASGFPLSHHTVFFSGDYPREFGDLLQGRLPADPTIYVCAQDRAAGATVSGPERLFLLVNAPANADRTPLNAMEIATCEKAMIDRLAQSGLAISGPQEARLMTTPADFARLFPGTGGALYGRASHGWAASFRRPGARSSIRGLYLAGGGVHPGPGLPMAALSGSHAAIAVATDLSASIASFHATATPGGMSTRSARTAATL
jgi:1-hydroxycarotenoid 3,4-desaturase